MIRNVRIHIEGSLPVVADLRAVPQPVDVTLLCTNMRTTDGKRPTFIEDGQSWFVIPLSVVRFIEMPADALESAGGLSSLTGGELVAGAAQATSASEDELDYEPDEAFLQRIRDI
jgi:hypothetical protein